MYRDLWAGCRLLALGAALCGCGPRQAPAPAAQASFPAQALVAVDSQSGRMHLEVRSAPQPPGRGLDAFRLTVTDAAGQRLTGLSIQVQPWMPNMGHGSSVTPSVTEVGAGSYDLGDVYLAMPGTWQLRITLSDGQADSATPSLQIP